MYACGRTNLCFAYGSLPAGRQGVHAGELISSGCPFGHPEEILFPAGKRRTCPKDRFACPPKLSSESFRAKGEVHAGEPFTNLQRTKFIYCAARNYKKAILKKMAFLQRVQSMQRATDFNFF